MTTVSTLNRFSPNSISLPNHSKPLTFTANSHSHFPLTQNTNRSLFLHFQSNALTVNNETVLPKVSESMIFSLFQGIGFDEKEIESLLQTNTSLTHLPFQTIRSRIQHLQSTGITAFALSKLISKRPHVLTGQETGVLLLFLVDFKGKIEPAQVERLLNVAESRFLLGFERKVRLLIEFGIGNDEIVKVLNNVNLTKALCLRSLDELDRMLSFLGRFGGADLVLRRPAILNYDLDTQLVPRIGFLLELSGGNEVATATVLRKLPFVLAYTVDHVKDHVEFLNTYAGLSYEEIFKIILVYPSLFSASRKRKLHPRIDFLKQCGFSSNDIFKFLIKAPLFLSLSFEGNLAHKLVFLLKIGYENGTKELALAMGAVTRCSSKNLQEVIGVFLNYGLTSEDIFDMSKKHPQVLQYNHESLEEKLDYLIEEMGREVGEILAFPAFLGYKLDGRIKHRYEVRRKIVGEGMSINKLLSVSAARFSKSKKNSTTSIIVELDDESEG